jgi:hypothetical protein
MVKSWLAIHLIHIASDRFFVTILVKSSMTWIILDPGWALVARRLKQPGAQGTQCRVNLAKSSTYGFKSYIFVLVDDVNYLQT